MRIPTTHSAGQHSFQKIISMAQMRSASDREQQGNSVVFLEDFLTPSISEKKAETKKKSEDYIEQTSFEEALENNAAKLLHLNHFFRV